MHLAALWYNDHTQKGFLGILGQSGAAIHIHIYVCMYIAAGAKGTVLEN